jgi:hypothetical protein
MRWTVPSEQEIRVLQTRRDEMVTRIAALERRGGRIDWRHCGDKERLCVRVDRTAPPFGDKADYYVVEGY